MDEKDYGVSPRVLCVLDHGVQDASLLPSGERRTVSRRMLYVELGANGQPRHLQYAPYLDYRPLAGDEATAGDILARPEAGWIATGIEQKAQAYAIASVVWEKGDKNPLILPSTIPIDDARVQFELTRYLSDAWAPIIERDIDGPNSLPVKIDNEQPNLGRLHATRRVARTVYMGSAPTAGAAHRGLEDRRVTLGCVMPGEPPAVFGDALRRLAAAATYLYQDGARVWYDTVQLGDHHDVGRRTGRDLRHGTGHTFGNDLSTHPGRFLQDS